LTTAQTYANSSLALNGDFLFGMEGLIAGMYIKKLKYELTAALTSDKLQISINIILDSTIPVHII
jgi:hypothetical protein